MTTSINDLNSDLFREEAGDDPGLDPKAARKKAMDFLARREYGQAELIGRLKGGGFDAAIAEQVVTVLTGEGLQSDARFATSFAQSKLGRGSGPLRIRQALAEKGLAELIVDDAMGGLEADWEYQARKVRTKKYGRDLPVDYKEKARQMRFLQYRGFDHDQIRAAMRSAD